LNKIKKETESLLTGSIRVDFLKIPTLKHPFDPSIVAEWKSPCYEASGNDDKGVSRFTSQ